VGDASGALLTTCGSCDKFTVSSENVKTFSDDYLILLKYIRTETQIRFDFVTKTINNKGEKDESLWCSLYHILDFLDCGGDTYDTDAFFCVENQKSTTTRRADGLTGTLPCKPRLLRRD
jgi:hypothetical protein